MVKMSRMVEYAILILTYLSKLEKGEKMSAREISENYDLPLPTVSKILKQLAKEHIVVSMQGSKGGYMLVKDTDDITLKMLIEALDGNANIVTCLSGVPGCDHTGDCPAKDTMEFIDGEVTRIFEKITLSELLTKTKEKKS